MEIYTLTFTDTEKGLTPEKVETFFSLELAQYAMKKDICDITGITMINISDVENEEYEYEWLEIGCDYATIKSGNYMFWEIYCTEISDNAFLISEILRKWHMNYHFPNEFDNVVVKMLEKRSYDSLVRISKENSYEDIEHSVMEELYQNALVSLGGRTDGNSYEVIHDYLDSIMLERNMDYSFMETILNGYGISPDYYGVILGYDRWFLGMLILCDGNKEFVKEIRNGIDNRQPSNFKIFEKERKEEIKEKYGESHRSKCSKLTDEQYQSLMYNIENFENFEYDTTKADKNDFRTRLDLFYLDAKFKIYDFIKKYGTDEILNCGDWVMELTNYGESQGWDIEFGTAYDVAYYIEELKKKYN